MTRLNIDYGIDLGTTNSSICRFQQGVPEILKITATDVILPSCVGYNVKKAERIGRPALDLMSQAGQDNVFIEFKRQMGTDETFYSSYMDMCYTPEDLSSKILQKLKMSVKDEVPPSNIVITVPMRFTINQKDATRRAAELAGFEHCELLQEPIAAAMAYGLTNKSKNEKWMVFDFGGGTFDVALLNVSDGIIDVVDTDGDNYLGGKNLDEEIINSVLIPYLSKNFDLTSTLNDPERLQRLKGRLKRFAEEMRNALSFDTNYQLTTDLGILGEDDQDKEMEIDLVLTSEELGELLYPHFRRALDICQKLMSRNNILKDQSIVVLVGGPTYSPILRQLIKEEISTHLDTSIDPMTAVVTGACLYAATIRASKHTHVSSYDSINLQLHFEASSVEETEWVTLHLDQEWDESSSLFVECLKLDGSWSSGKIKLSSDGELLEVPLVVNKANSFQILAYDQLGNKVKCNPSEFTIIQGTKIGQSVLPYSFSVEIVSNNKPVLSIIKGLEKNTPLPAVGVRNELWTINELRAGNKEDVISIPLYQCNEGDEGIKAIYSERINILNISGEDLPSNLPASSEVNLIISVDRSERVRLSVYFPSIDFTIDEAFESTMVQTVPTENELLQRLDQMKSEIEELGLPASDVQEFDQRMMRLRSDIENGADRKQVLDQLKTIFRDVDRLELIYEWPNLEKKLINLFADIRDELDKDSNAENELFYQQFSKRLDVCMKEKSVPLGIELLDRLSNFAFELKKETIIRGVILKLYVYFDNYEWSNRIRAKELVSEVYDLLNEKQNIEILRSKLSVIIKMLPNTSLPKASLSLLKG